MKDEKNKKIARIFKWVVIQSLFLAAGIAGLYYYVDWAKNIFLFLVCFGTAAEILIAGASKAKAMAREIGLPVPQWLSSSYDMVIVLILASVGHFFFATLWVIQIIAELYIYNKEVIAAVEEK